jgi:hypothetical protein
VTGHSYYEPTDEDADDLPTPTEGCDCNPHTVITQPWQHRTDCAHYAPPLQGPGSTPAGRQAARRIWEQHRRETKP